MFKSYLLFFLLFLININIFAQPGDPNVFGTTEWIVYGYDGNNFNTYSGFYTEPNLTFDTRNRWGVFNSPSDASGYAGNVIPNDQHSCSHKRTNFTCGTYQVDITNHDDDVELLINGISVLTHAGWGDSHTSAYYGFLGPTSTIELRVREGGGHSHSGLSITQINTNPGFTISSSYDCSTGETTISAFGATGVTWSPATDLNTTSGLTVIATPTTTTTYTASGISDCNGSSSSETITVNPSHLSLNPNSDYGDGEWYIYCYDGNNFNTYNGYYTEPNLVFDTRNRWGANDSPSDASDYNGCTIPDNQHSYSHKRTNFACGEYIIDITNHDDDVELLIDGVSTLTHAGWGDSHSGAYTGFLGPTSTVELRVREGGGGSHSGLSVVQQNSNPGFTVSSSYNCSTGETTLTANGGSGFTWSPATGLNTTSGTSVIATPSTTTTYTVTGISDCNGLSTTETVTVSPSHLTLDPTTYFGDGEWTVFCYDGNNFNTYSGYYTEGDVDFDSRNRWGSNNTPSDASGYAGCIIPSDQHSYSYKRTNFACGTYTIDIAGHDDYATLFIDGAQVWNHNGCCDVHNGAWIGTLTSSSTVEFRTREFGGGSYAALNLNAPVSSTTWIGNNTAWNTASNWTDGIPDANTTVSIPTTSNNPNISSSANCNNITIDNGATLTISGSNSLTVSGNWTNNGSFVANTSTLSITDNCNTTVSFNNSSETTFHNLTINSSNNVNVSGSSINLQGTLTLTNGVFNTNNSLTLLSNASGTANIAAITGGSISGSITMERYIDAGQTNWRFFTSPVLNSTLEDWNDDFETSGFLGTDAPDWPSATNRWPSMYFYYESVAGAADNGYEAATNTSNLIGLGRGVSVWCGDTITGTQPFVIDVSGTPNTGSTNTILSFSNGTNLDDGWNLVGNPYPSAIDWDSPNINKVAMNNATYIWDPDAQQYATYINGMGTNGGSSIIPSSQAFFVQATSNLGQIQYSESCKTNSAGAFLKSSSNIPSLLIDVTNNSGGDQSIINLNNTATAQFDHNFDAHKIDSKNANYPSISSISNGLEYAINQTPTSTTTIPIKLTTGASGIHQLKFTLSGNILNKNCVTLVDIFTNTSYNLLTTNSITLFISDTTTIPRFILNLGPETIIQKNNPNCYNGNDGSLNFSQSDKSLFNIHWLNTNYDTILTENAVSSSLLTNLNQGIYYTYTNTNHCLNIADTLELNSSDSILVISSIDNNIGNITLQVSGGTPPYNFIWSNGSNNQNQTNLLPGIYNLTITDINNCIKNVIYTINTSTGISSVSGSKVKIFPNPTKGFVNLQMDKKGYKIELYNNLGQNIFTEITSDKLFTLNSNLFANGIYMVKISNASDTFVHKLIFE